MMSFIGQIGQNGRMTKMIVERKSIVSGKVYQMDINITEEQLFNFINGRSGLAQEAFPDLSIDEREFIISGIHPTEWNELFGNEEE
jgi:hypothetical protein